MDWPPDGEWIVLDFRGILNKRQSSFHCPFGLLLGENEGVSVHHQTVSVLIRKRGSTDYDNDDAAIVVSAMIAKMRLLKVNE